MDALFDSLHLSAAQRKLVLSVLILVLVLVVRWVVLRAVHRRLQDAEVWFRTRKYVTYAATLVVALALTNLWLGGVGGALTYLGIVSAGVAIALADVLKNLAGWAYILTRRPFRVGDRVEIGGNAGDVVDIRVLRFTVLEIGNWVDADQSTGRLIHIPNGLLFTEPLANATESFPFLWDEVPVLVTFESDWELGERILAEVMAREVPDPGDRRFAEQMRVAAQDYFIRYTHLEPTVYVSVRDSGVLLTGRYLVPARERRGVQQEVWKGLLRALADNPTVDLAYPTVRTVVPEGLRVRHEPAGPASGGPSPPVDR